MLSFVKRFLVVVALAAGCAALLVTFVGSKFFWDRPEDGLAQLSTLVDAHIDMIFSPLESGPLPIPQHEVRALRERFVDAANAGKSRDRQTYSNAVKVCDGLLGALAERERESTSLADCRSKPYARGLSGNQLREEQEKRRFFEFAITRRWVEAAVVHRQKVFAAYSDLRENERNLSPIGFTSK